MKKTVKSRSYKDKLKGHRDGLLKVFSPYGVDSGMLLSASSDGCIRGENEVPNYKLTNFWLPHRTRSMGSDRKNDNDQAIPEQRRRGYRARWERRQ